MKTYNKSFYREVVQLRKAQLVILAPHASIDKNTEVISKSIAEMVGANYYGLVVSIYDDYQNLHIPSTEMPKSWMTELKDLIKNKKFGISIHGHNRAENLIIIGGLHKKAEIFFSELSNQIKENIKIEFISKSQTDLNGINPENVINKFQHKGIQIELSQDIREDRYRSSYIVKLLSSSIEKIFPEYLKAN